jgi:hypothetical protein
MIKSGSGELTFKRDSADPGKNEPENGSMDSETREKNG